MILTPFRIGGAGLLFSQDGLLYDGGTMLYTRAGDKGKTKLFGCSQECSKSSIIAEALGTVDEINSFIGLGKIRAYEAKLSYGDGVSVGDQLEAIQQDLFIIQAELAGAGKTTLPEKIIKLEAIVDTIEKELPPIKTFFVSGGTELAATFDFGRTIARRAERRVIAVTEEGKVAVSDQTKAYLNRLSSVLYALARLANHVSGVKEQPPTYQ